jgi:hypothetical protein
MEEKYRFSAKADRAPSRVSFLIVKNMAGFAATMKES